MRVFLGKGVQTPRSVLCGAEMRELRCGLSGSSSLSRFLRRILLPLKAVALERLRSHAVSVHLRQTRQRAGAASALFFLVAKAAQIRETGSQAAALRLLQRHAFRCREKEETAERASADRRSAQRLLRLEREAQESQRGRREAEAALQSLRRQTHLQEQREAAVLRAREECARQLSRLQTELKRRSIQLQTTQNKLDRRRVALHKFLLARQEGLSRAERGSLQRRSFSAWRAIFWLNRKWVSLRTARLPLEAPDISRLLQIGLEPLLVCRFYTCSCTDTWRRLTEGLLQKSEALPPSWRSSLATLFRSHRREAQKAASRAAAGAVLCALFRRREFLAAAEALRRLSNAKEKPRARSALCEDGNVESSILSRAFWAWRRKKSQRRASPSRPSAFEVEASASASASLATKSLRFCNGEDCCVVLKTLPLKGEKPKSHDEAASFSPQSGASTCALSLDDAFPGRRENAALRGERRKAVAVLRLAAAVFAATTRRTAFALNLLKRLVRPSLGNNPASPVEAPRLFFLRKRSFASSDECLSALLRPLGSRV